MSTNRPARQHQEAYPYNQMMGMTSDSHENRPRLHDEGREVEEDNWGWAVCGETCKHGSLRGYRRKVNPISSVRRGRSVIEQQTLENRSWSTPREGSGLNAAIRSNETRLWGSTKWGNDRGRLEWRSTLPSPRGEVSRMQMNLYFKNGSAIINPLPGMKSNKRGADGYETGQLRILPRGYAITGDSLQMYPSGKLDRLQNKHGNPGSAKTSIALGQMTTSMTYEVSKLPLELGSQHGGKITEQAKARGNALDRLGLNSAGLRRASLNPIADGNRFQDLDRVRTMTSRLHPKSILNNEEVKEKQKELVELAKLEGIYDKAVLNKQLILARSKSFREHAVLTLSTKPGSNTPGVDGESLKMEDELLKEKLISYSRDILYHPNKYKAAPIKRVWIPKPGKSDKRPLGIPTIKDRALQMITNLVLLPLVEMTSDPNSYGFRPYRDCKMAIAAVRNQLKTQDIEKTKKHLRERHAIREEVPVGTLMKPNQDKWILDADIKGFFDNINHEWLMSRVPLHPELKKLLSQWLKAKVFDEGTYVDPESGTPQGGTISPTLANFTLNGLEGAVRRSLSGLTKSKDLRMPVAMADGKKRRIALATQTVRYADDFVVITRSKNLVTKHIMPKVEIFLRERGLRLSPQKTKIYCINNSNAQLDFLGYTFKYRPKWSYKRTIVYSGRTVGAIALYPNRKKVVAFIEKIKKIFRSSQNLTAVELIAKLNPIIRGWANYYNLDNSSRYRTVVKEALYRLTWEWMRKKHPTLGKITLAKMYLLRDKYKLKGEIEQNSPVPEGGNKEGYIKFKSYKWVFYGDSKNQARFSQTASTRTAFLLNPVNSSPIVAAIKHLIPNKLLNVHAFDEQVTELVSRKVDIALKSNPKTPTLKEKLYKRQNGKCYLCDEITDYEYLHLNTMHIHHINPIKAGGNKFAITNLALTHSNCHREHKH